MSNPKFKISYFVIVMTIPEYIRAETPGAPERHHVRSLIHQLGDPSFTKRETANRKIEAIGEPALPALRAAVKERAPLELRRRAQHLIRQILLSCCKSKTSGIEFALIDAASFEMGSPDREYGRRPDELLHTVRITMPYVMGIFEITQEEYEAVMKTNPSWFSPTGLGKDKVAGMPTGRFPVEQVSWFDAAEFCNRLSKQDGYEPYYLLEDLKLEKGTIRSAKVTIRGGTGYRLPTEAEWEYACRAGDTSKATKPYYFKDGPSMTLAPEQGNFGYTGKPLPVGSHKNPNRFGLHEMHGNIWEWCEDYYGPLLGGKDPVRTTRLKETEDRVLRGGSYANIAINCRAADRAWSSASSAYNFVGLRLCLPVK